MRVRTLPRQWPKDTVDMGAGGKWARPGSALDLDFARRRAFNRLTGRICRPEDILTVARASGAGAFNEAGIFVWSAANDTLRYDFHPVTHECLGALIEEARTNLARQSEDCTSATWVNAIGTTSTKANAASPWHSGNAFQITATTANGGVRQVISVASSTLHYLSFIVESGVGNINILSENGGAAYGVGFSATVNTSTGGVTGTNAGQVSTTPVIGGWLVKANFGTSGATAGRNANLELQVASNGQTARFAMVMFEAGSCATSYIPTAGATATRAADFVSMLTSAFQYSMTEGSAVVEFPAEGIRNFTTAGLNALTFSDGTLANRIVHWITSSKFSAFYVIVANVNQAALTDAVAINNGAYRAAVGWNANDFAMCASGAGALTDVTGTVPTVDRVHFGGSPTGVNIDNHLKRVTYWPVKLSNGELQRLSALN